MLDFLKKTRELVLIISYAPKLRSSLFKFLRYYQADQILRIWQHLIMAFILENQNVRYSKLEAKLMKDFFSRFLCAAELRPKIL